MELTTVKAVITGGASGLGLASATRLIKSGATLRLFDVNQQAGMEAAGALGERASFAQIDVTDESAVRAGLAAAANDLGGLNVIVNCAGVLGSGRVLGKNGPMELASFMRTVQINLVGSFCLAKEGAALMQHNPPGADGERGVIIHTASIAAFEGQIGQAAYAAAKGGVVGMTLPMARELARFGIRVMCIAPGVFHTPMVDGMPEDVYQSLCAQVPFPSRLGTSDEYARLVEFLLTERYFNGSVVRLDGAIRLAPK